MTAPLKVVLYAGTGDNIVTVAQSDDPSLWIRTLSQIVAERPDVQMTPAYEHVLALFNEVFPQDQAVQPKGVKAFRAKLRERVARERARELEDS